MIFSDLDFSDLCKPKYSHILETPGLEYPWVLRYFFYCCDNEKIVSQLKQCIQAGDGTPLVLPKKYLLCSNDMKVHKKTVPAFRYNPARVSPYTINNGNWYLVCIYYDNNGVVAARFISFYTDTQQEIKNYLDQSYEALLHFVPLPDTDTDSSGAESTLNVRGVFQHFSKLFGKFRKWRV